MSDGAKIDWSSIFTTSYRVAVIAGIFAILYLKTLFVTHEQLVLAVDPYRQLPARVADLGSLSMTGVDTFRDLALWRTKKDEIDTRLLTLMETQQYMMLRQQTILDRQQEQINASRK